MKSTCRKRDTFFVAGLAEKDGKFDGLYLGRPEGGKLVFAGKVERGFGEDVAKELRKRLLPLRSKKSPFIKPPKKAESAMGKTSCSG